MLLSKTWLIQLKRRLNPATKSRQARLRKLSASHVDLLEPRQLLSAAPIGGEFQVNTYTSSDQSAPAIATDADGNYVVTWQSNGQDGSGWGVYGQRYDASGAAVGGEFLVNSFTDGDQSAPAVAMSVDGDFVVTWQSNGQDGSGDGVYAQRYQSENSLRFDDTVLSIVGTESSDDISISETSSNLSVSLNGVTYDLDPSLVTLILIHGLDGDDNSTLESSLTKPAKLYGGDGNDSLTGGAGNDVLDGGAGDDIYRFNTSMALGSDSIIDSGGIDRLSFVDSTDDVEVDLGTTAAQTVNANLTLTLASASSLESLYGGSGNDILIGNSLINNLVGGDGNDTVSDLGGSDYFDGGTGDDIYTFNTDSPLASDSITDSAGTDRLDFTGSSSDVSMNLSLTTAQAVNPNLTLTLSSASSMENVSGGSGNDTLTGNSLNNQLIGNDGNDILTGAAGGDTLDGGAGNDSFLFNTNTALGSDSVTDSSGIDRISFSGSASDVSVDLSLTTAQTVNANATLTLDSATSVENATGGFGNDILTGNTLPNNLVGGDGNDTLTGAGGDDLLDSGAGNDIYQFNTDTALGSDSITDSSGIDRLSFAGNTSSVKVNLGSTAAQAVNANLTLTLPSASSLENLYGGSGDDMLTGSSLANVLDGGAGNDSLFGGEGADTLYGRAGNDALDGGNGNDTYAFNTNSFLGSDNVTDSDGIDRLYFVGSTNDVIVDLGSAAAQAVNTNLTLMLTSASAIENVYGGSGNDAITGNALANVLDGGAGNDSLFGGDGNDALHGQAGDDTLDGGNGNDNLNGGEGGDEINGRQGNDTYTFDDAQSSEVDTVAEEAAGGADKLNFSSITTSVTANLTDGTELAQMNNRPLLTRHGEPIDGSNISSDFFLYGRRVRGSLWLLYIDFTATILGEPVNGADLVNAIHSQVPTAYGVSAIVDSDYMRVSYSGYNIPAEQFWEALSLVQLPPAELSETAIASMRNRVVQTMTAEQASFFENLAGGSAADKLTGNALANGLVGGAGNDSLFGGEGADVLSGQAGDDTLDGGNGNDTYPFNTNSPLGSDDITDGDGIDTLSLEGSTNDVSTNLGSTGAQVINANLTLTLDSASSLENLFGGSGNDTLTGNSLANRFIGGPGNDVMTGGAGNDRYDFDADWRVGRDTIDESGGGIDTLNFSATSRAVSIDLSQGAVQDVAVDPSGGLDALFLSLQLLGVNSVENVVGGSGGDRLIGNALNNTLTGGPGDDLLTGGAGNDTFLFDTDANLGTDTVNETGGGVDTLDFSNTTTQNIIVDLSVTTIQVVNANLGLQLSAQYDFEHVRGGALNDILIGNSRPNTLTGNGGHDVLSGRAGNDILQGGAGRNVLIGGFGADTLTGGAEEDLLLGARYLLEEDAIALAALRNEWISASSFDDRVAHLMGTLEGGVDDGFTLTPSTVKEDSSRDTLNGGSGRDWYLRNNLSATALWRDVINDPNLDSVFTDIDTWL